jgi:hypothetical protein
VTSNGALPEVAMKSLPIAAAFLVPAAPGHSPGVCPSHSVGRAHGACGSQARREEESMWVHR